MNKNVNFRGAVLAGGVAVVAMLVTTHVWAAGSVLPGAAQVDRVVPKRPDSATRNLDAQGQTQAPEDLVPIIPRPDNANLIPLTLTGINLTGVTAYDPSAFVPLWQDRINRAGSLADLYDIADAITRKYRDDGYVVARAIIPEQDIAGGVAQIEVFEGKIGAVSFEGNLARTALIEDALETIRAQRIFNTQALETSILRLDDLPGTKFRILLKPGKTNAVDVVVMGERDDRFAGEVVFSNTGSKFLGPYIASVPVTIAGLFSDYDEIQVSITTSVPTNEVRSGGLSYQMPLPVSGLSVEFGGSITRGAPGHTLENDDIKSVLKDFDIQLDYSAWRQRNRTLVLSAGFGMQNAQTQAAGTRLSRDHVRNVFCQADFSWRDGLMGISQTRVRINQGIPDLWGGSSNGDADLSRASGRADYTTMEFEFNHTRPLGEYLTVFGALQGQVSSGPLLSTMEFGYGGAFYGRAYDPSQIVGDSGIAGVLEIRTAPYVLAPSYLAQPFVFADYGTVWNRDDGQPAQETGLSAGLGVRVNGDHGLSGEMMLAHPLLNADDPTYSKVQGSHFLFSLGKKF
jgi:hemolysin activation/secretion protein